MKHLKTSFFALLVVALFSFTFYACRKEAPDPSVTSAAGKKVSALNAPTLTCASATGASITLTVTAGPSGAPAGFSVQWMLKSEFDANGGWPASDVVEGSSFCKASFSGVPGGSKYNLAANGTIQVTIGDVLFDDIGASSPCSGQALTCGETYVFRSFAHNDPRSGAAKSIFSVNKECSTLPCSTNETCTYTQGYWKTHGPADACLKGNNTNVWPVTSLTIGEISTSDSDLCTILNTPAGGTNLGLAHQLIAALLNQANGADVPAEVQTCINNAQDFLAGSGGAYGTVKSSRNAERSGLTECLADYNEGATGPGHCQ